MELKDILHEEDEARSKVSSIWKVKAGRRGSAFQARATLACARFSAFRAENACLN